MTYSSLHSSRRLSVCKMNARWRADAPLPCVQHAAEQRSGTERNSGAPLRATPPRVGRTEGNDGAPPPRRPATPPPRRRSSPFRSAACWTHRGERLHSGVPPPRRSAGAQTFSSVRPVKQTRLVALIMCCACVGFVSACDDALRVFVPSMQFNSSYKAKRWIDESIQLNDLKMSPVGQGNYYCSVPNNIH